MTQRLSYVYYSYEEFGRGYIGSRLCPCGKTPETDTKYFGSFKDKTFKPTNKIILEIFKSHKDALEAEQKLHEFYQVNVNPHFANKAKQSSSKFVYISKGSSNYQYNKGTLNNFYNPSIGIEYNRTCSYMHHKYNLHTSSLLLLTKNQINSHYGWVLLGKKIPNTAIKYYKYNWLYNSEILENLSGVEISEEIDVHISIITELITGKRLSYKGLKVLCANLQPHELSS